jgi:hypothetical protein
MFHSRTHSASPRRRAVILMVVLVLLTLFAIVGLAFVLYANAEGEASRVYRETNIGNNVINISSNSLASFALGQFLFDTPDPQATSPLGPGNYPQYGWSAIRGHSVARDIYGYDADSPGSNIFAFNGPGHLHITSDSPLNYDGHALMSYVPWYTTPTYASENFVRDPERLAYRTPGGPFPDPMMVPVSKNPYGAGWNSSYTYPDGNHVFLGAVDGNGYVLARSFVRPYLVPKNPNAAAGPGQNQPYLPLDPNNPNYWSWFTNTNPNNAADVIPPQIATLLKYTSLRPRNIDMDPSFPAPQLGGDVQNLTGYPGGNDSVWLDLDYPVQVAPNGTKFKPLFAFFIMDMDGRLNLNVHGNIRGGGNHISNQGWGPWEVNLQSLANSTQNPPQSGPEWNKLFVGNAQVNVQGRYTPQGQPLNALYAPPSQAPVFKTPRVYAQIDYDGSDDTLALLPQFPVPPGPGIGGNPTGPFQPPQGGAPPYASFPVFPNGYNNGSGTNPTSPMLSVERWNHPSVYDSQYPPNGNSRFTTDNLTSLLNGGPNSTTATACSLGQLMPNNLSTFRLRNLTTTDSAAMDRAGLTPWLWDRGAATPSAPFGYGLAAPLQTKPNLPPAGGPTGPGPNSFTYSLAQRTGMVPATSDFRLPNQTFPSPGIDWRSFDAALGKVDLNRYLSPYPHQGQDQHSPGTFNPQPLCNPNDRFDNPIFPPQVAQQWQWAVADRQNLANDIYRRLLAVTGVTAPATPASPTAAELAPRRWLAQLAVNIVDFIDEDEISTPFNFYGTLDGLPAANIGLLGSATPVTPPNASGPIPNDPDLPVYWVFGTELPKVVLMEAMAEIDKTLPATSPVKLYVELFNPMPSLAQLPNNTFPGTVDQQDNPNQQIPLFQPAAGSAPAYSPYIVVIADWNATNGSDGLLNPPTNNDTRLGRPNWIRTQADFNGQATQIGGGNVGTGIAPQQFFMMVPSIGGDKHNTVKAGPAANNTNNGPIAANTPTIQNAQLQYNINTTAGAGKWTTAAPAPGTAATGQSAPPLMPPTTPPPWPGAGQPIADDTTGINVLLRRLANPHLPYNPNPLFTAGPNAGSPDPTYNPYITVDYMQNVGIQDETTPATQTSVSFYKTEPYNSKVIQSYPTPAGGKTTHSFGQFPTTQNGQYHWLTHLDRQLISPMELLQVSGFEPWRLTQRFLQGGGATWQYVNWYDESFRLYRAFEVLTTHNRAGGVSFAGRQPGMVNINTIYDPEQFFALADPQQGNAFYPPPAQALLKQMYNQMLILRSPGMQQGVPNGQRLVTGTDRPFLGMGIGRMNNPPSTPQAPGDPVSVNDDGTQKASSTGIEDTFLRSYAGGPPNPTGPRLFDVASQPNSYQTNELMRKMFGNITTRSNVFAVWVTVGFFQVAPGGDLVRPVKLGAEIGAAQGNNIRHQFFTVIDRTRMMIDPVQITTLNNQVLPNQLNQPMWVSIGSAFSGNTPNTNIPYNIQPGSILTVDNGNGSEETIVVQAIGPPQPGGLPPIPGPGNWIYATFTKPHGAGANLNINGNPGPQTSFSITAPQYPNLVLTYSVLK